MNWKRPLKAWADEYRATMLNQRVRDLIRMANWDLHFGPSHRFGDAIDAPDPETEFPGFEKACLEIIDALSDVPRRLWVDTNSEECFDSQPASLEPCYQCDERGASEDCELCHGYGEIDASLEDVVEIDRREILQAIVGADLAEYVR